MTESHQKCNGFTKTLKETLKLGDSNSSQTNIKTQNYLEPKDKELTKNFGKTIKNASNPKDKHNSQIDIEKQIDSELIEQARQRTIKDTVENELREHLYRWITKLTKYYLSFVGVFLSLCFIAHILSLFLDKNFQINSFTTIIITLLATTTFNIISLSFIITKALFK